MATTSHTLHPASGASPSPLPSMVDVAAAAMERAAHAYAEGDTGLARDLIEEVRSGAFYGRAAHQLATGSTCPAAPPASRS